MYGVVVWARRDLTSAIIWCADNKNLAYLTNGQDILENGEQFSIGDLVWTLWQEDGAIRTCQSLRVVARNYHPELTQELLSADDPGSPVHRIGALCWLERYQMHGLGHFARFAANDNQHAA